MKKQIALLLIFAMLTQLAACGKTPDTPAQAPAQTEMAKTEAAQTADADSLPSVGEVISGFTLQSVEPYAPMSADVLSFTHETSGAQLCYIKNSDTNRAFSITYRTPHVDESDSNHVFEHAIIASSEKYPSKDLYFDLSGKTYNTFINAFTNIDFTTYPASSQSEEQLRLMADAYLSCMVNPGLLGDDRFFKREAIRYMLYDVDEPITMGGSVFSEDLGNITNTTIETLRNIAQTLWPGEYAANMNGRAHINYRDLTYEGMVATFERCYSFDNSLILLYGDLDYRSFLEFLDAEYLSKAKKRGTDLSAYDDPVSAPGYVEETVYSPAFEGADTQNASVIAYAMDLDGQDWETIAQYGTFASLLNSESSVLKQKLRAAGITAPTEFGADLVYAKPAFYFLMFNADPEDAPAFKDAVDSTLADIAKNGLDSSTVDTVLKSKALGNYTLMENTNSAINVVFPSICRKWAKTGETNYLTELANGVSALQQDTEQTLIRKLAATLKNAPHSAMVTTVPKPGMVEEILAEQEAYLAEMKASMTPEELEQMVTDTLAFDEWNASEQSNDNVVIPVADLPEPEPAAEFAKEDSDGVTYYSAASEIEQISLHRVYFDSSAVPQEDLYYFSLYPLLLLKLTTGTYSKAEKANLMAQYLHNLSLNTLYPDKGEHQYPMFSVEWYCMAQDYEKSLKLLMEIMGEMKFDDKDELAMLLDGWLPSLDKSRGDANELTASIAGTWMNKDGQYDEYLNGQRLYEFVKDLRERLESDPKAMEEISAKFEQIQKLLLHKDRMVVMNVAPQEDLEQVAGISKKVLGGLPSLPSAEADYDFPKYPDKTAVIVEGANYYTRAIGDISQVEGLSGSLFPFVQALNNRYILPVLRFQGLAYSAGMSFGYKLDNIYAYTYSDPNVSETAAAIAAAADALDAMELTQEELDGYILNAYSTVTSPDGNLTKYRLAMSNDMTGFDGETWRRLAGEIKTATVADKEKAVEVLRKVLENQRLVTVGNSEKLQKEADSFDKVYDYRKPLE